MNDCPVCGREFREEVHCLHHFWAIHLPWHAHGRRLHLCCHNLFNRYYYQSKFVRHCKRHGGVRHLHDCLLGGRK